MTTIHKILKSLAERARNLSVDTEYNDGYRKGYHHALDEVAVEVDKAVVSDSEWLSPNDEERAMQVSKLKSLFPSYPTGGVKWQYMNGLLEMAEHILDEMWILERAGEITERHLTQNVIKVGSAVEDDPEKRKPAETHKSTFSFSLRNATTQDSAKVIEFCRQNGIQCSDVYEFPTP